MAAEASINLSGITEVQEFLNRLNGDIFSKSLMGEIGAFISFTIKKRTMEGVDVDGSLFAPYSPSYALFRREKGRSTKVNLFFTGSMLSSMTWSSNKNEVRVYFLNTSDSSGSSNPKKAFFLNQSRNFFALSEDDIDKVVETIENYYADVIERG